MKKNVIVCIGILMTFSGCRQRAPQDGVTKHKEDDGTVVETRYAAGRLVQQATYQTDGTKQREVFFFYFHPDQRRPYTMESADRESIVEYGSKGQVISHMTKYISPGSGELILEGKRFTDDGKIAVITDSTGMLIYYPSGKLQFEKRRIGDRRERQTFYDSLGVKREEWETLNGLRHGMRKEYNAQGKIITNEIYDNGNKIQK